MSAKRDANRTGRVGCSGIDNLEVMAEAKKYNGFLLEQVLTQAPAHLLVYVPAFAVLFTATDRKVGRVRRYRRGPLCRKVEQAGFAVGRAVYVDSLGFFATLAYRLFGDRGGSLNPAMVAFYDSYVSPVGRRLDPVFARLLGKNVLLTARKPFSGPERPDNRPPRSPLGAPTGAPA